MTDTRTRRPTRQRNAIEADVDRYDEFRSAQEIHASLVSGGDKIGLATVYRTLQAMVDEEALDACAPTTARSSTDAAAPGTTTTSSAVTAAARSRSRARPWSDGLTG